jgi:hypothetical protein
MSLAPTLSPSVLQSPTYSSSVDETPAPNNQQISVPPDTAIASSIPGSGIRMSSDLFAGHWVGSISMCGLRLFTFLLFLHSSSKIGNKGRKETTHGRKKLGRTRKHGLC